MHQRITDPIPGRFFTGPRFLTHQHTFLQRAELRPIGGTGRLHRFLGSSRPA